ncbi:MAG: twin-arginine translocase TatA/TatE family subunit [Thermoleophilia bacterium]
MFDISPIQILIVLVIALLVFGPKRLPEMGRSIGRGIREFKGAILDDGPATTPARPVEPTPATTTAPASGAAAAAVTSRPEDDDAVLEGLVVPGDAPPRSTDPA